MKPRAIKTCISLQRQSLCRTGYILYWRKERNMRMKNTSFAKGLFIIALFCISLRGWDAIPPSTSRLPTQRLPRPVLGVYVNKQYYVLKPESAPIEITLEHQRNAVYGPRHGQRRWRREGCSNTRQTLLRRGRRIFNVLCRS